MATHEIVREMEWSPGQPAWREYSDGSSMYWRRDGSVSERRFADGVQEFLDFKNNVTLRRRIVSIEMDILSTGQPFRRIIYEHLPTE